MLHDRQLSCKQTVQFLAELFALVLNLKLPFVVRNIVEYRLDLSCFLLNLSVELFILCLLLRKLRFDLSILLFKLIVLTALFLILRYL